MVVVVRAMKGLISLETVAGNDIFLSSKMGYEEILKDPRRFLNFDETSIHLGFINKLSYNSWKKEERQNNEHKEFNEIQEE